MSPYRRCKSSEYCCIIRVTAACPAGPRGPGFVLWLLAVAACSNYDAACSLQALNCHRDICSVPASLTSYMRAIKSLTNVNLWPQYCSAAPRNHQQAIFLSFTFYFNFHTKQRAFKFRDVQSSCT